MGINLRDILLLSPELSLLALAVAVLGIDLFVKRKGLILSIALLGLLLPLIAGIVLWTPLVLLVLMPSHALYHFLVNISLKINL